MKHEFRFGEAYHIEWRLLLHPRYPRCPILVKGYLEFRGSDLVNINGTWTTINLFLDRMTNEVYFITQERITYSHVGYFR